MSTHTPGPWTVMLRGERGTFHVLEAQRHEAEHTSDGVDGYTVSSANARLIAAAPDLLHACKVALPLIEEWLQGTPETADLLRAAIAKAESKQS